MERKKIKVTKEIRESLMQDFNVQYVTLTNYLNFARNSKEAEMIREAALQRGGKLVTLQEKEVELPVKKIKILDNKGNVKAVRTI